MTETFQQTPTPETYSTLSTRERNLALALDTVTRLSDQVGNELTVKPVDGIDGITPDPGIYMLDTDGVRSDITGANFDFLLNRLSGAADSAHSVIPGELEVNHVTTDNIIVPVVAKCYTKRNFDDRFTRMRREVQTMQIMRERGALTTEPVAVVIADPPDHSHEKDLVVITHYNPNIVTMDNFSWSEGMTEDNRNNALLAASALGTFHTLGFSHGDAKIKNVAQDQTGRVGMIDYETSLPLDTANPDKIMGAIHTDMGLLVKSLKDKGFFGTRESQLSANVIREFIDELMLAYSEQWVGAEGEVSDAVWHGMESAIDSALPGIKEQKGFYILTKA